MKLGSGLRNLEARLKLHWSRLSLHPHLPHLELQELEAHRGLHCDLDLREALHHHLNQLHRPVLSETSTLFEVEWVSQNLRPLELPEIER